MPEERRNNGSRSQNPGGGSTGRRSRRRGKGKGNNNERISVNHDSKFIGKYPDMHGNVFQCHNETDRRDQYERTVEELSRYASTFLNNSRDIKIMLSTQREVTFTEPQDPPFSSSLTQRKIWEKEVDLFMQRKEDYHDNKHVIFSVVLGQCSNAMKTQLKMNEEFSTWEDTFDVVSLLTEIQAISERFDSRTYFLEAYTNAIVAFFCIRQGARERINDYLSRFRKIIKVANHYGATLTDDEIILKHELMMHGYISTLKEDTSDLTFEYEAMRYFASERLKAYLFVAGSDENRFKDLHKNLRDSMALQQNIYPTTLSDAVSVLQKFDMNISANNKNKDQQNQQQKEKRPDGKIPSDRKKPSEDKDDEGKEGVSLF